MRNYHPTAVPAIPDVVVAEQEHAHLEPAVSVEVHARHEELVTDSEKKEGAVAPGPKPLSVFLYNWNR